MPPPKTLPRSKRKKALQRQIPEALLARLWRERATRQQNLRTTEGRRVRVLYPGRRGTEAGPDFRDALIYTEASGLVRGDVELHLHPRDWDRHGHASDHRYNSVVLHGVLAPPGASQPLPNGGAAPAVELSPLLDQTPESNAAGPISRRPLWSLLKSHDYPKPATRSEAFLLLERAGKARFLQKAVSFAPLMEDLGAEEALYQALMESLGYSENRSGFLELAQRVPYRTLMNAVRGAPKVDHALRIKEILLETAGFTKEGDSRLLAGSVMDRRQWRLFRIRPANHPRRRIAGAAVLLHRTSPPGLLASTLRWIRGASFKPLLKNLTVADPSGGPALIGRSRALDMAVNVFLPLMHAHGLHQHNDSLSQNSLSLFLSAPRLQPNRITREMEKILFPKPWRPLGNAALRQQGLIHLHRLIQGEG